MTCSNMEAPKVLKRVIIRETYSVMGVLEIERISSKRRFCIVDINYQYGRSYRTDTQKSILFCRSEIVVVQLKASVLHVKGMKCR